MTYDFAGFDPLRLTDKEREILSELRRLSDECGCEYGCIVYESGEYEFFTDNDENQVTPPCFVDNTATLYHSHTNETLLSSKDFKWLLNENVSKVVSISCNNYVQVAYIGNGNVLLESEFDDTVSSLNAEIDEEVLYNSQYDDYSEKELQLQAFYEQAYRIPRHFKWTTEGGKL